MGLQGGRPARGSRTLSVQPTFSAAFRAHFRRRWFAYLALGVFYALDIYLTLLLVGTGQFVELNPLNRHLLLTGGPMVWIAFRVAALVAATFLAVAAITLTVFALPRRHPGRARLFDGIEEVAVGSVIVFYAFAMFHNVSQLAGFFPVA